MCIQYMRGTCMMVHGARQPLKEKTMEAKTFSVFISGKLVDLHVDGWRKFVYHGTEMFVGTETYRANEIIKDGRMHSYCYNASGQVVLQVKENSGDSTGYIMM